MKILNSKEDAIEFLTWIATLESGIFGQATGALQNALDKYCCLGVGCVLTIPENKLKLEANTQILTGGYPDHQRAAPTWLVDVNSEFWIRTGQTLSSLNDRCVSHPEIAKRLLKVFHNDLNEWFI